MPYLIKLHCKLFADDITLYKIFNHGEKTITDTILEFKQELSLLLEWCTLNRIDINWSKTFIMFVSGNRKVMPPLNIEIDNNIVTIVKEFKLLGIITLNFQKHILYTIKKTNPKLYSIKNVFHLPLSVRLQNFKTFILPLFDYCLSLIIYFPKYSIQKLQHYYYTCLFKLFGLCFTNYTNEETEISLKKFGLISFEYRVFFKLGSYLHKILYSPFSPPCLKELLLLKIDTHSYRMRCADRYETLKANNHYGKQHLHIFLVDLLTLFSQILSYLTQMNLAICQKKYR